MSLYQSLFSGIKCFVRLVKACLTPIVTTCSVLIVKTFSVQIVETVVTIGIEPFAITIVNSIWF